MEARSRRVRTAVCTAVLGLGAAVAVADWEECRSYRDLMRGLDRHFVALLEAVLRADLPAAGAAAAELAEQPHPPLAEEIRVLGLLGVQAGGFRAREDAIRAEAGALRSAAGTGDLAGTSAAFRRLVDTCLGCHERYRAAVREGIGQGVPK